MSHNELLEINEPLKEALALKIVVVGNGGVGKSSMIQESRQKLIKIIEIFCFDCRFCLLLSDMLQDCLQKTIRRR